MEQLCLFCRGDGVICIEREGDLGTYVECSACDALDEAFDNEPTREWRFVDPEAEKDRP